MQPARPAGEVAVKPGRKSFLRLAALAALLSALVGCGSTLTGPQAPSNEAQAPADTTLSPPLLTVQQDGSTDFVQVSGSETVVAVVPDPETASAKIDGIKGGKVGCGRFTVIVPPGAYFGIATITITIPDPTVQVCDLSISPAIANQFAVPVQLVNNLKDCSVDARTLTTYWYDTGSIRWVDMKAATDSESGTVTANLRHFSKYGTGKAGW